MVLNIMITGQQHEFKQNKYCQINCTQILEKNDFQISNNRSICHTFLSTLYVLPHIILPTTHSMVEKTEAQRLEYSPKITQLGKPEKKIYIQWILLKTVFKMVFQVTFAICCLSVTWISLLLYVNLDERSLQEGPWKSVLGSTFGI